ncbi:hypothetical protein O6H91_12G079300 [Diphasiastrum complanatum]|uniref:Uncharacterized protein n=2 Tax=Diphasiastrum complanatum TaxID=34168 RepID=A0ACC2C455_DIPCM|nr:hypothetical protein O6H91_12G075600 [Diphasiastrum complanatum]KAJ7536718.1 hypothetical protein O6H91_12G079300 [Diphasiastrum complanatum]
MRIKARQLETLIYHSGEAPKSWGTICWDSKPETEMIKCNEANVSYTSLRDILPPLKSCKQHLLNHVVIDLESRTPIKNHLVEQAARAYLQPMVRECNQSRKIFVEFWQKLPKHRSATAMYNYLNSPIKEFVRFLAILQRLYLSEISGALLQQRSLP